MIEKELLQIIACPWCVTRPQGTTLAKGELELIGTAESPQALQCRDCKRVYAVREGTLPDLVVENARTTA